MKQIVDKILSLTVLQPGSRFKFPDDDTVYEFWYIHYMENVPHITYIDSQNQTRRRNGFYLKDLIRCKPN